VCKPSCIERQIRIGTNGVEQSSSTATRCGRGYETKDATAFRDELGSVPLRTSAVGCRTRDVRVGGEKAADGANVQRWYDCPDCGYEAPSRIVYGAER